MTIRNDATRHAGRTATGVCGALLLLLLLSGCGQAARFAPDATGQVRPWTHERFLNHPGDLRFAVIADRTGGAREGIFEAGIAKLDALGPEFVLCVGDLIEGHGDAAALAAEHDGVDGMLGKLSMPFFFLPGNHDIANTTAGGVYDARRGSRHYSFLYKDALFLVLDAQDGPVSKKGGTSLGLGEAQLAWAEQTLAAHPAPRWTFVLMHQPLWFYEEGGVPTSRHHIPKPVKTGLPRLEAALADRDYTVLAGHFHQYIASTRHGRQYIVLPSTGGNSPLRGTTAGEFDGVLWVAMPQGGPPRLSCLRLDGILDRELPTEERLRLAHGLAFTGAKAFPAAGEVMRFSLPLANPFPQELVCHLAWDVPAGSAWTLEPPYTSVRLAPGQKAEPAFTATAAPAGRIFPLPVARLQFATNGQEWDATPIPLPLDIDAFLRERRPTLAVRPAPAPVTVDGRLDEAAWQRPADIPALQDWKLEAAPLVATRVWLAGDQEACRVAFRCDEPRMDLLKTACQTRDGAVYQDDSVDVMLGPDDGKPDSYCHVIVNAAGTVYDAKGTDTTFDAKATVATTRDDNGWTVELALPWSAVGGMPAPGAKLTLLVSRTRPARDGAAIQILQYPPLNGWNLRREMHGYLVLDGGYGRQWNCRASSQGKEHMPTATRIEHVIAYRAPGRYGGWPANYGMWAWGSELLLQFTEGAFVKEYDDAHRTHRINRFEPIQVMQARSLDDGRTWTTEPFNGLIPGDGPLCAGDHGERPFGNPYAGKNPPMELKEPLDFSSPETLVLVGFTTCHAAPEPVFSWFYASRDRGRTWGGPYRFTGLDESLLLAGRTDIVPLGPERALFMLTCHKSNGQEGRVFCAETRDGGRTFRQLSWLAPELDDGYEIMPSSVRLADGRILTASRVGTGKYVSEGCIRLYESKDDGRSWQSLPLPVPATGRLSNPPALLQLRDGRLCLVYGFRNAPSGMRARLSDDAGRSWSAEIILRADGGDHDLGYPQAVLNSRGQVVTAYYYNTDPKAERFIGVSLWDAERED